MYIETMVCNMIRHTKIMNANWGVSNSKPGEIEVTFKLALPVWCQDDKLIVNDRQYIQYSRRKNKKTGIETTHHTVTLKNISHPYPNVSNNKFFCETRKYNIIDFINEKKNVIYFLREERRKIFKELQMSIKLEEIGVKTRDWEALSNGTYNNEYKLNYGMSRRGNRPTEEIIPF